MIKSEILIENRVVSTSFHSNMGGLMLAFCGKNSEITSVSRNYLCKCRTLFWMIWSFCHETNGRNFFSWLVPLEFSWPKVSVMFILNRKCFVLHENADFLENSWG